MGSNQQRSEFRIPRRRFLQGVGVGAAAVVVAPEFAQAQLQVDKEIGDRPRVPIGLKINGATYRASVEPASTLLDVLRNQLDLTGTKRVCDRAECGACTVLYNGKAVYACVMLALDAQEGEIQTIEGLSADGRLHPLQEAFVHNDALQCGFCTPGMVMACKALLDHDTNPSPDQVKRAISGNLCKCGTYPKIFRAVQDAARTLRERS
jgi:aerobic-type carbon monoxide dehydrogenase small subunit (CoxS/CutS family)